MLNLQTTADGVLLTLSVQPGAKREGLVGLHGDALKLAVMAPPERGKANTAVIETLADALKLERRNVELISGATSRRKRVRIRGLSEDELNKRLAKWIDDPS